MCNLWLNEKSPICRIAKIFVILGADCNFGYKSFFAPCIWVTFRPNTDSCSDNNANFINSAKKDLKKKNRSDSYAEFFVVGVAQSVEH